MPPLALSTAAPETCAVPTVPPPTLTAPPLAARTPTLPPLRLNTPLFMVAAPTLVEPLPRLTLPWLSDRMPLGITSAPLPLPPSSENEPPAPTATLDAVIGPAPWSVKEAVAAPLPSMTSVPTVTGSPGPVTETLEFDGGAISTLAPDTGGAVPATLLTVRLVNCRPVGW